MAHRWRGIAVAAAVVVLATAAACYPETSALARPSDPVVLTGGDLPGSTGGLKPREQVAVRRVEGGGRQVPVQVDERHVANLAVVHNRVAEAGVDFLVYSDPGTLTGADPVPTIDGDDEIVFMAGDAGGRAAADGREPAGVVPGSGFEVIVTDTGDDDAQGFVYLFRRAPGSTLDPAAGRDYVAYDFDLVAGEYPEDYRFEGQGNPVGDPPGNPAPNLNPEDSTITTSAYTTHFDDRWRNDALRITTPGATGVDILDRHKVFPAPGPDPRPACVRSENTFAAAHGAFVSNIDGPVRAIRDYIGANSGQYTQRRHVYYQRRQDTTTFLRAHPLPEGPDDVFDYTEAATGMTYRNNLNGGGVTIDGRPDSMVSGPLAWEQVSGEQGTLTMVHRFEITQPGLVAQAFYADDRSPNFVQCTGDAQAFGTSGPTLVGPTLDTDPRDRGGPGAAADITGYRTQYYDGPDQSVAAAEQRDRWARNPLVVGAVAWPGSPG